VGGQDRVDGLAQAYNPTAHRLSLNLEGATWLSMIGVEGADMGGPMDLRAKGGHIVGRAANCEVPCAGAPMTDP